MQRFDASRRYPRSQMHSYEPIVLLQTSFSPVQFIE